MHKKQLMTTTSLLVVSAMAIGFGTGSAAAQDQDQSASDDTSVMEEIIVTSRRRSESLQNVPISISALSAADMQEKGITNVEDVGEFVPNLTLTTSDRANNTRIVIRGIGGGFPDPTQSFGTGLYINGVYIPNSIGGYMSTLDIERVEVLRGPQGTQFGKNTTGGAINIITKKPDAETNGSLTARLGSFGRRDVRAMFNTAITDDLFVRVSGAFEHTDGYYHNTFLDITESGKETKAVTASIRWQPTDQITVDQIFSFSKQNDDNKGGQCRENGGAGANGPFVGEGGPPGSATRSRSFRDECNRQAAADKYDFTSDKNTFSDVEQIGLFNQTSWDSDGGFGMFETFGLRSNLSYRRTANEYLTDRDYTFVRSDAVGTFGKDAQLFETYSLELLFDASANDGRFQIVGGYNYFDNLGAVGRSNCHDAWKAAGGAGEIRCDDARGLLFELAPLKESFGFPIQAGPPTFATNIIAEDRSHGAFMHATFETTYKLNFEAGIRYTRDRRKFRNLEWLVSNFRSANEVDPLPPGGDTGLGEFDNILNASTVQLFGESAATFTNWTPQFIANYTLDEGRNLDQGLFYSSVSKGFLTGGFNTEIGDDPAFDALRTFGPETVWTYEVGFKGTWFDGMLRTNFSFFFSDYSDKQEQITIDNSDGSLPGDDTIQIVDNVASVDIKGFEFEMRAVPWDNGFLSVDVGYLDSEFSSFTSFDPTSPSTPLDLSNLNTDDFSAKWTLNAYLEHTFELGNRGTVTPRIGAYYQSSFEYETDLTRTSPASACFQDGYAKLNARMTWRDSRDTWQLAFFGDNLSKKDIFEFCDVHPGRGATFFQLEPGRRWGVELSTRF